MYITRDLAPVRLFKFLNNRKIWSLFKKAWDKDATGYLRRCYYYKNGSVVNTVDFNRFIRAIGVSRSDLTDIDYDGIESAWFEINLPTDPKVTIADVQAEVDGLSNGITHTITFNIGYAVGGFTETVDPQAVLESTLNNIESEIATDNVTFHKTDLIDAHILHNGDGFEEVSRSAYTLVDSRSNYLLIKASVSYKKISAGTAIQRTVDLINGDLVLSGETNPISFGSSSYNNFLTNFKNSSRLWTFSEFDSLTRQQFVDLFTKNFDTDYDEEDAEWWEIILVVVVIIVAAVFSAGYALSTMTTTLGAYATLIGTFTLLISAGAFVLINTVGMGAIGMIRIFGKIIEILGIASSILGIYAIVQKAISSAVEHSISFYVKSALKVFNTYNKFFGDGDESGAKDTTKENQDMINHSNEFIFTKSFETTEIEEHYQLMFDIDRFTHV